MWLSRTTLIAVPPVLLLHWLTQMAPAINSGRLSVAVADSASPRLPPPIRRNPSSPCFPLLAPTRQTAEPLAWLLRSPPRRHAAAGRLWRGVDPES